MPSSAVRLCLSTGCRVPVKGDYCDACKVERNGGVRYSYDQGRGNAAQRGYDAQWRKKRKQYLKENPFCVWCGKMAKHVDHVIPLRRGGEDHRDNYQSLCHSCHSSKTAKERK